MGFLVAAGSELVLSVGDLGELLAQWLDIAELPSADR